MAYVDIFQYGNDRIEIGYIFFNNLFRELGFGYPSIFIFVSFLQLLFFFLGIKDIGGVQTWALFFYFTTLYFFLSLNVLRQTLVFSIFIFSIKYIKEKKFICYLISCLLASLFHKSALILIPVYFLSYVVIVYNQYFLVAIYILSILLSSTLSSAVWNNFSMFANILGYSDYAEQITILEEVNWGREDSLGVLTYLWIILNSLVILNYKKIRNYFGEQFNIYFCVFYIGIIVSSFVSGTYLERPFLYILYIKIIIYAYFFAYLFRLTNSRENFLNKVFALIYLAVFILNFYFAISNHASDCSPFNFIN